MNKVPSAESTPNRFSRSSRLSSPGATVLLVWDDPLFHDLSRRALKPDGYDVRSVQLGARASAHWRCNPVELLVLDATRDPRRALTFFEDVRKRDGALPVIVIAGTNRATKEEAVRLGAATVLDASLDVSRLLRAAASLAPFIPGVDPKLELHGSLAH